MYCMWKGGVKGIRKEKEGLEKEGKAMPSLWETNSLPFVSDGQLISSVRQPFTSVLEAESI